MKVGIIDYGMGNISSISSTLKYIGVTDIIITNSFEDLLSSDKLILPGVGSFANAMKNIKEKFIMTGLVGSVVVTLLSLGIILLFVFGNGMSKISFDFLTGDTRNKTTYVIFEKDKEYKFEYDIVVESRTKEVHLKDTKIPSEVYNYEGDKFKLSKGLVINKIGKNKLNDFSTDQIKGFVEDLKKPKADLEVRLTAPGNGIFPLIMTTLFVILFSIFEYSYLQ